MGQQVALAWPNSLQSPDEQIAAMQQAFQKLQQANNSNATSAAVVIHVPSFSNSAQSAASGSYANIPGFNWTIKSQGGLVCIDASISGSYIDGLGFVVALVIDGKAVLINAAMSGSNSGTSNARSGTATLNWKAVLGAGQHTISIQVLGNGTVNGTARTDGNSSASIIEFPGNVQALNVSSN